MGLFSDCRSCKLLFRQEWLSQIRVHISQYLTGEKFTVNYILYSTRKPPITPGYAHMSITRLFLVLVLPLLPGQKGTSGMTFWSRCKGSITVAPQLCSHISSVRIATAVRFYGRWPRAWPRLRCAICFQGGGAEASTRTHTHTESAVPYGHAT